MLKSTRWARFILQHISLPDSPESALHASTFCVSTGYASMSAVSAGISDQSGSVAKAAAYRRGRKRHFQVWSVLPEAHLSSTHLLCDANLGVAFSRRFALITNSRNKQGRRNTMNTVAMAHDSSATQERIERTVARMTGTPAAELRRRSVDEQRRIVEQQHGRAMRFVVRFPIIGRGNVLREKTKSHEEINRLVDETL